MRAKILRKRSADRSSPPTLVAISMPRKPEGFVQPVELGDSQVGGLERHRAERHEAVGVTPGDVGEVVVDDPRRGDAEIGVGAVIGLVRRRRNRLDVDPHQVHVGQPLFDRGELDAGALGLLAVDLAGALVGEDLARVASGDGVSGDHLGGLRGQHVAVDVDREPFAAGMRRARKPPGDRRAGRQAFEQHFSAFLLIWRTALGVADERRSMPLPPLSARQPHFRVIDNKKWR